MRLIWDGTSSGGAVGLLPALAAQCRGCPIYRVCGGGMYTHRYRPGSCFANPSVYYPDLMHLIGHIAEVMRADVSERLRKRAP